MPIPKVIHQLWKDDVVPDRYRIMVESWRRHHPEWEYRLWTDETLRAFVAAEFPDFLDRYDSYPHPICRTDAARYLILFKIGGVYADLDMECFRRFDELIADRSLVVGVEPDEHLSDAKVVAAGLDKLLCPSVIASEPGHSFWPHMLQHMREAPLDGDPLDATGPFILTRAHDDYAGLAPVTVLPSSYFYPIPKAACWSGQIFDIDYWERHTRDAFALHYWDGSWFRAQSATLPALPSRGKIFRSFGSEPEGEPAFTKIIGAPLVSCLLVTKNRYEMARLAVQSFLNQTYPNKELVILDDGDDRRLADYVVGLGDNRLRMLPHTEKNLRLGRLRNITVDAARGAYVCQWDDDDLYDPKRLEMQMNALVGTKARAVVLKRVTIWIPAEQRLLISHARPWEGTLICEKAIMPRYPDERMGEDTPVLEQICERYPVAHIDVPRLYIYCFHGQNTWSRDHFNIFWDTSESRYTGDRYEAVVEEISKRLPVLTYKTILSRQHETSGTSLSDQSLGFNLFGHFAKGIGLATGARGTLAAITALRRPYTSIELENFEKANAGRTHFDRAKNAPYGINIFHTNPDLLEKLYSNAALTGFDQRIFEGHFNIGYWAWETPTSLPAKWLNWLDRFDEIWVPSHYVVQCLAPKIPVPVVCIPHVVQPRTTEFRRSHLKLPEDRFVFFSVFDELSDFERKNPRGVIEAYKRAFPDPNSGTMLVIKARTLSSHRAAELVQVKQRRPDIEIYVQDVSSFAMTGYFANCDAFISLHRAEGFGLTIAEAMEQRKPVIVTGYSGNMDFTKNDNSYLVNYRMVRSELGTDNYPAGTLWAEPDLDHAASLMRAVFSDREQAQRIGLNGAETVHELYNSKAVADAIDQRIRTLIQHGKIERKLNVSSMPAKTAKTRDSADADVLVLTPVKNAARFLPRYFELLKSLDYDPARISLGFLEGDSDDDTYAELQRRLPELRARYRRVELIKQDFGLRLSEPRWAPSVQRARREVLANVRNRLLADMLNDEEWVLWLDADLVDYPPGLLKQLQATGKDIVVPRCVRPDGRDFDLNTFRFRGDREMSENPDFLIDGIFQPPRGEGRLYLGDLREDTLVTVDGVGGTALLIRGELHRKGLVFPADSYRGYIETEGLAMMAGDMGYACWALPRLQIVHSAE